MAARSGGAGLEPTTLVAYGIYVNRHITPRIGATKLSQLTVPAAHAFEDQLRKGKLKVGVNIPSLDEIRAIIAVLTHPRWRPLLLTAIFTGLRASELRGLRWVDVDLKRAELHVRQRADALNKIGRPKSEAGERTVPLPPTLVQILREWKLASSPSELGLVFATERGSDP